MSVRRLQVIHGQVVPAVDVVDPARFQAECVEEFVASWTARGFSEVTIANDVGVLERMLAGLGRPAWEVTAEDVDRVVGSLASKGRAASTRRNYLQVFRGFHRFLEIPSTTRRGVFDSATGPMRHHWIRGLGPRCNAASPTATRYAAATRIC